MGMRAGWESRDGKVVPSLVPNAVGEVAAAFTGIYEILLVITPRVAKSIGEPRYGSTSEQ
jgi:hypothetical protein